MENTADTLFRDGRRAADAGNYSLACPMFEASYHLDPALGTLLNLADCEEHRGQLALAAHHFRQLWAALPTSDDRRALADSRARTLELRAPKLRIVLATTAPAIVTRDNVTLPAAMLGSSVAVDPGHHVIVVTAAGRQDKRYDVSLGLGEEREVAVSPGESSTPQKPPVVASTPLVKPGSTQRTAAFALGGVGAVALVTGTIFGVVALSHLTSANAGCDGNVCANQEAVNQFHSAQSFAIAADVTLVIGAVLVGGALFLAFTAPHASHSDTAAMPAWMGGRF